METVSDSTAPTADPLAAILDRLDAAEAGADPDGPAWRAEILADMARILDGGVR